MKVIRSILVIKCIFFWSPPEPASPDDQLFESIERRSAGFQKDARVKIDYTSSRYQDQPMGTNKLK